jgi:hypothetical protein
MKNVSKSGPFCNEIHFMSYATGEAAGKKPVSRLGVFLRTSMEFGGVTASRSRNRGSSLTGCGRSPVFEECKLRATFLPIHL